MAMLGKQGKSTVITFPSSRPLSVSDFLGLKQDVNETVSSSFSVSPTTDVSPMAFAHWACPEKVNTIQLY